MADTIETNSSNSTSTTTETEGQISAGCVAFWSGWLTEYRVKLAPLALMNGVRPEVLFLGVWMNQLRVEVEELTSALREINDDSEPWQKD